MSCIQQEKHYRSTSLADVENVENLRRHEEDDPVIPAGPGQVHRVLS